MLYLIDTLRTLAVYEEAAYSFGTMYCTIIYLDWIDYQNNSVTDPTATCLDTGFDDVLDMTLHFVLRK